MRFAPLLLLLLIVPACSATDDNASDNASTDDDNEVVSGARCERDFSAPLRAKVAKARLQLDKISSSYAADVRAALDEGRVKPVPFCAITPAHFEHFKKDADLTAFGATPEEQYRRLRLGETRGMKSIHDQLYGYQWDDRIYIATNMNQELTLETLGHETRHVLRKAHERNFNDQRVTCVEELEAARAEVLVKKDDLTPEEDRALLARVQELYELDKIKPGTCGYK